MYKVFLMYSAFLLWLCTTIPLHAEEATIIDSQHYSSVFSEMRNYRIFLPPDYDENPQAQYPVIYFFHGWSQRYFGITGGDGYDKGDHNGGDNIARYVSGHKVIVVKWDGYNIREGDDYNLRPYNIGPVETHRQFPLYFPELVRYIDAHYRTIPDREHRAVSGLSMGGFMTFWIGGKYPDMVCAAGNFCGSPEFVIGPKAFPVEYRHIDMYKNYGGMNIRLNFGNEDFIRSYHNDMNRIFPYIMDNYEFGIYEAAHSTCGLGEMFDFILRTFENPPQKPELWHHIDVYPEFSVWDYTVSSDRSDPGFTVIENVNRRGFRSSVREFLPDGENMPYVTLTVTTAPIYKKEKEYIINDYNLTKTTSRQYSAMSDTDGKLKITLDGYAHDIGINKTNDVPNLTVSSYTVENMNRAAPLKNVDISVGILNKGGEKAEGVSVELRATRDNVKIINGRTECGGINVNEIRTSRTPLTFFVTADSSEVAQFEVIIRDSTNRKWVEFIEVPVRVDYPEFTDIKIADGLEYTVAAAGTTQTSILMGFGNGDGIANPGESIVVLAKDINDDLYRRTTLYTSDRYVNPNGIHRRLSDYWGSYDHVGGSHKISVPVISSDCPDNHVIEFVSEYWLPDYPDHNIKRGIVNVVVSGKDTTPPQIQWVKIPGNNVVQVKVFDGGNVDFVNTRLKFIKTRYSSYLHDDIDISLNDDGANGDTLQGDNVFSVRLPEQKFGLFTVEVEAGDNFGNKNVKKFPDIFTVY